MTHGREYFGFLARPTNAAVVAKDKSKNPFQDMAPKEYEFRVEKPQAVFSPTQLSDFLDIAESLASYNEKWEPLLFLTAPGTLLGHSKAGCRGNADHQAHLFPFQTAGS